MPISVPQDTCYYYEISKRETRIVLCLPRHELDRRVAQEGVDKQITVDYSRGLDVTVYQHELDYLEKHYNLKLEADYDALCTALLAYHAAAPEEVPKTGFLPTDFLDRIVNERPAPAIAHPPASKVPGRRMAAQRRIQQHEQRDVEAFVRVRLRARGKKRLAPPKIKMTAGDDAAQVFSRMQQRAGKGGV